MRSTTAVLRKQKGGVVYVEVDVENLVADAEAALAKAEAAVAKALDAEADVTAAQGSTESRRSQPCAQL